MESLKYIYPTQAIVNRQQRESSFNQHATLIWFTGLSGSGKSTLAIQLEVELRSRGFTTYLLDGDTIRSGLNKDLSFENENRAENLRRIAEVSKLFLDAGMIILSAFISPSKADRDRVKEIVGAENYIEVFVDAPLEVCEQRDVKGLYKKARAGEIKNFTGIGALYEVPTSSDVVIPTSKLTIEESINDLMDFILPRIAMNNEKTTQT